MVACVFQVMPVRYPALALCWSGCVSRGYDDVSVSAHVVLWWWSPGCCGWRPCCDCWCACVGVVFVCVDVGACGAAVVGRMVVAIVGVVFSVCMMWVLMLCFVLMHSACCVCVLRVA